MITKMIDDYIFLSDIIMMKEIYCIDEVPTIIFDTFYMDKTYRSTIDRYTLGYIEGSIGMSLYFKCTESKMKMISILINDLLHNTPSSLHYYKPVICLFEPYSPLSEQTKAKLKLKYGL